jgi:hypothetical protein
MTNKTRSDDRDFQTEIMRAAAKGVQPPTYVELKPEHMSYWNAITEARAEWTKIDLIHAANLARTMYSIEYETKMLDREGSILENARGTPVMNPRFAILEQLSRRAVALSAKLQVHAAATIGEVENNKKKNKAKQKAVKAVESMDEDDLLAKPVLN